KVLEDNHREHQQAAGEDNRHDAGLIYFERHVIARAAEDTAATNVLGALHRNASLAEGDEDDTSDDRDEHSGENDQVLNAQMSAGPAKLERGLLQEFVSCTRHARQNTGHD